LLIDKSYLNIFSVYYLRKNGCYRSLLCFLHFVCPSQRFFFACTRTSLELGLCYRHGGATWRNKLALPAGQGNPHQDLLTDRLHKLGHELTT